MEIKICCTKKDGRAKYIRNINMKSSNSLRVRHVELLYRKIKTDEASILTKFS